ncbi:MAG: hypothetical protein F2786_03075 [Actinobacteria bacterium]|uniref:Unannotated protein n=1 Tax=freshwater metagenome TaxID=449393 RepID=A0A6J7D5H2_9ZZZZ|nr:hypothetical protein [Actinomycetota bacterium]
MRIGRVVFVAILALLPLQLIESQALASDNCLVLNSRQYLQASTKLIPVTSDFTIEFDFYLNKDEKSYAQIISQGSISFPFFLGITPDLEIRAGGSWPDTGAKMPVKSWTHIALTHSAAEIGKFYLNGKLFSSTSDYLLKQEEGTDTRLGEGAGLTLGEFINGCIDNLRIWNTVRTPLQIGEDAQVATSISDASLLASYEFNSVTNSGLIESSTGSNNSFKPSGSPEFRATSDPWPINAPQFNKGGGIASSYGGFYVAAGFQTLVPESFGSGFGWYSTLWALTATRVDKLSLGLSSTWIIPNNKTVSASTAQKLCANDNDVSNPNNGTLGLSLFQTIEGSLGWWGEEKFSTAYPKYMVNVTQNCYSTQLATPGWGFFTETPTAREQTGLIQISNQILMPPDGMVFQRDDSAPQLGVTWHSLNLPRFDHAFGSQAGDNSWTLFMNSSNFKGPLVFVAPQFWVDGSSSNPLQKNLTLDVKSAWVGGLASEWNEIPYYKYVDLTGKIYTKIPDLEVPVDSNGEFSIGRDFRAYSSKAISSSLKSALIGTGNLPTALTNQEIYSGKLVGNSPEIYQGGKTLGTLSKLLSAKTFDSDNAYGFSAPGKSGMIKLPQYFLESENTKVEIPAAQAPEALVRASFGNPQFNSFFVYQYPSWWDASPSASSDLTTDLSDGSQVVYRWYKFVDQPALQRFELNSSEKANLQSAIEKMQKEWAHSALMSEPTKGSLATFDQGMLVTPPKGLEYGYVPIVIKQYISPNADRIAAAELKAKQAAELKAKQEAEAKAAAELKAKQEAEAKAAAELKAKQEAEAKAAAKLKAKQEAEAKAAALKKTTITCIKGKLVKKVTAIKPVCPKGYKKR